MTTFLVTAWISHTLNRRALAMPSYWVGLVGLLAIGIALIMSWRGAGDPGVHGPVTAGLLRGVVAIGAVLWLMAMVFPFL
ncbi:MAG TPA: hypothetical protein VK636_19965 [Gemmatimonadaceae bacterium]|nr:hypothetical protein [Gemmatimonadaceae bacterium]